LEIFLSIFGFSRTIESELLLATLETRGTPVKADAEAITEATATAQIFMVMVFATKIVLFSKLAMYGDGSHTVGPIIFPVEDEEERMSQIRISV
jgi:hypothetical protein